MNPIGLKVMEEDSVLESYLCYSKHSFLMYTCIYFTGGSAVLSGLTRDMSVEYATMLMAAVVGTYTFIGGLGATFYVSFFNTAMICVMMLVFVVRVYDDPDNESNPLGKRIVFHLVNT